MEEVEVEPKPMEEMINYFPTQFSNGEIRMAAGTAIGQEEMAAVQVGGSEFFKVATCNVFSSLGALVQGGYPFEELERAAARALEAWRPFVKRREQNYRDMTAAGQKVLNEQAP